MPAPPSRDADPGARRDRDGGFSLVEIIVAFAIFAALTAAVASISLDSLRTAGDNRERVRAASLAAEEVERVRAQFRSAPLGVGTNCLTRDPVVEVDTGERYTLACASGWVNQTGQATTAGTPGALLRVEVSVRWPAMGDRPAVINTTVLS